MRINQGPWWWYILLISVLKSQRHTGLCEFKVGLVYKASTQSARVRNWDPVKKNEHTINSSLDCTEDQARVYVRSISDIKRGRLLYWHWGDHNEAPLSDEKHRHRGLTHLFRPALLCTKRALNVKMINRKQMVSNFKDVHTSIIGFFA